MSRLDQGVPSDLPERIVLYTAGVFDPTAGGSGIFNYLIVEWALDHGLQVAAICRASEPYRKKFQRGPLLDQLVHRGLSIEWCDSDETPGRFDSGLTYLKALYKFGVCCDVMDRTGPLRDRPRTAVIAHDTGWVLALAASKVSGAGILSDPQVNVMQFVRVVRTVNPLKFIWRHLRHWRLKRSFRSVNYEIVRALANGPCAGYLAPQHATELRGLGLNCQHFKWFSKPPALGDIQRQRPTTRDADKFVLLHVGLLGSSASLNMVRYWRDSVINPLGGLPFDVEIRLVGHSAGFDGFGELPPNVTVTPVGFVEDLAVEYAAAHVFVSLSDYPVGIRTRILTALAHAVPVVTHPVALQALPELTPGHDVIAVDSGDAFAEFVGRAWSDVDWLGDIGVRGRKAWEENYNPAENIPLLLRQALEATVVGQIS